MRTIIISLTLYFLLQCLFLSPPANGHGRLLEPPGRSSIWRFPEFELSGAAPNWNDNELNCGGVGVQHDQNGGKCGICGDRYDQPEPRPNEDGGTYGKGIIVRRYEPGQEMDVFVELTTAHMGHFVLRLCPEEPVSQECLDRHVLEFKGPGVQGTKYYINKPPEGTEPSDYKLNITTKVQLPYGLSCNKCVLQWHYVVGNSWGTCNGTSTNVISRGGSHNPGQQPSNSYEALGCGPQETFRSCADISIA